MDGALRFDWDDYIAHLARRCVLPEEVEQSVSGPIVDLEYRVTAEGEERWTAMGRTYAGRLLVVVWTVRDSGAYRAITAYPATRRLESVYYRVIHGTET